MGSFVLSDVRVLCVRTGCIARQSLYTLVAGVWQKNNLYKRTFMKYLF